MILKIKILLQNLKKVFIRDFMLKNFWLQVDCVTVFLNVTDVMIGTRHENGAIKCM